MLKYIKLVKLWNNVKLEMSKEQWYVNGGFYNALMVFASKCCSTFFEVTIPVETEGILTNNLYIIATSIKETLTIVFSIVKQIKEKKKQEEEF